MGTSIPCLERQTSKHRRVPLQDRLPRWQPRAMVLANSDGCLPTSESLGSVSSLRSHPRLLRLLPLSPLPQSWVAGGSSNRGPFVVQQESASSRRCRRIEHLGEKGARRSNEQTAVRHTFCRTLPRYCPAGKCAHLDRRFHLIPPDASLSAFSGMLDLRRTDLNSCRAQSPGIPGPFTHRQSDPLLRKCQAATS